MLHNDEEEEYYLSDEEDQNQNCDDQVVEQQELPTIVYVPTPVQYVEAADVESEESVEETYSKKYHDAARFWKPRPYFAKHWGMTK